MKLSEIVEKIGGNVVCGEDSLNREVEFAFASDLMSDVLTVNKDNLLLITGLANIQAVRTAEMSDLQAIFFVRNKRVSEDMIRLAKENSIVLIESPFSMFKVAGMLHDLGIKSVY